MIHNLPPESVKIVLSQFDGGLGHIAQESAENNQDILVQILSPLSIEVPENMRNNFYLLGENIDPGDRGFFVAEDGELITTARVDLENDATSGQHVFRLHWHFKRASLQTIDEIEHVQTVLARMTPKLVAENNRLKSLAEAIKPLPTRSTIQSRRL